MPERRSTVHHRHGAHALTLACAGHHRAADRRPVVDPVHPVEVVHPTRGNIIHYGIQVDDVHLTTRASTGTPPRPMLVNPGFELGTRSIGTHPKGRKGALLPSRGMAALPRGEVFGKGPGACEGGGVQHPKGAVREF